MNVPYLRKALVVTPFLPYPANAGHRLRVDQTGQYLINDGYEVHLIHLAFEGGWRWRHQNIAYELALMGYRRVDHFKAGKHISLPPRHDSIHYLDEWWDEDFEHFLVRHFENNFYDVVIVHNVWLSKALDFVPQGSSKVIEMHDLFSRRTNAYQHINVYPEFFTINETGELFGLNRANLIVAISDYERDYVVENLPDRDVLFLPYAPKELEDQACSLAINKSSPSPVIFGFIGSAHPFNVHGLLLLLEYLYQLLKNNEADFYLIVAGDVCESIPEKYNGIINKLGRIPDVNDFYNKIDIVISPVDYGSGLKIKVCEAIALNVPVIATRHSAEGTQLDKSVVVDDIKAIAIKLLEVAESEELQQAIISAAPRSRQALKNACTEAKIKFLQKIAYSRIFIVNYPDITEKKSLSRIIAFSIIRTLLGQGRVYVILPEDATDFAKKYSDFFPDSVMFLPMNATMQRTRRNGQGHILIDYSPIFKSVNLSKAIFITSDPNSMCLGSYKSILDNRLSFKQRVKYPHFNFCLKNVVGCKEDITVPLFGDSFAWDPAIKYNERQSIVFSGQVTIELTTLPELARLKQLIRRTKADFMYLEPNKQSNLSECDFFIDKKAKVSCVGYSIDPQLFNTVFPMFITLQNNFGGEIKLEQGSVKAVINKTLAVNHESVLTSHFVNKLLI